MDQTEFIKLVAAKLSDETTVRGLFLGGSFGRGTPDSHSDVDLIALVEPDHQDEAIATWRSLLEGISPVVFWNQRGQGHVLLNAITEDWLRCDLSIMPPSAFIDRAQDTVKPLIDRDGFYNVLPEALPAKGPDPAKVKYLINEFIRVLGLLRVVVGRGEYLTAVTGIGMLRDHFMNLMLEEVNVPDRGGALHLSKVLPEADMDLLLSLPFPKANREEVIDANFDIARHFLPRAYDLAAKLNLPWPDNFEKATLRFLATSLGPSPDWYSLSRNSVTD
ncbi:nucleotidyltransferase domain-containing protein [Rhizobium sp. WSM1274]|uniref:nucleotidyltransferase domain-containing protein n=1 Tax=Rhizobium sp. WSM1274 TaxID=3138254 RepID=UPI0021A4AFE0|nr:nucleotidyltransferase domain-containing protein [Rhizobium leguminosarum]UWU29176.1 nucleotidyltransferase domain-containing protein [Rhizobium leguminosarum bv. viciae]